MTYRLRCTTSQPSQKTKYDNLNLGFCKATSKIEDEKEQVCQLKDWHSAVDLAHWTQEQWTDSICEDEYRQNDLSLYLIRDTEISGHHPKRRGHHGRGNRRNESEGRHNQSRKPLLLRRPILGILGIVRSIPCHLGSISKCMMYSEIAITRFGSRGGSWAL